MGKNLENALIEIINKSIDGIDSAVSFINAEIPDVVHQLLTFEFFASVSYSLLGAFFMASAFYLFKKIKNHKSTQYSDHMLEAVFVFVILFPIGLTVFFANAMSAFKIIIAPKLYLIEYAADLIK